MSLLEVDDSPICPCENLRPLDHFVLSGQWEVEECTTHLDLLYRIMTNTDVPDYANFNDVYLNLLFDLGQILSRKIFLREERVKRNKHIVKSLDFFMEIPVG